MSEVDAFEDSYHRRINYLRVSVTDQCNLSCVYCMPREMLPQKRRKDILSFEEIARVVTAAAELGISKVRITGGEPLVRRGVPAFVRMIREGTAVDEICMTTNGTLLERFASELRMNGLDRINVSLDTLNPKKFEKLTRSSVLLQDVFRGVDAAVEAGFDRIKFNVVVVRGLNDDEIEGFVEWAARGGHNIRFIELMPTGSSCFDHQTCFVDGAEIRAHVERVGRLIPRERRGSGAEEYLLEGSSAIIGFIQSVSRPFCSRCNRLRLTAIGLLKPCLYSDVGVDLMPDLRDGGGIETLKRRIREVALSKPQGHEIGKKDYCFRMHEIGG